MKTEFQIQSKSKRAEVLLELQRSQQEAYEQNRTFRVLDVGGGFNSWLGDLVTDIIDINPREGVVTVHQGDVHDPNLWSGFKDDEFDFVNCTHLLEDVRDPQFVARQISRVGKAGFVAVPTARQEFSVRESRAYRGWSHHRWVFLPTNNGLCAMAKWPPVSSRPSFLAQLFGRAAVRLSDSNLAVRFLIQFGLPLYGAKASFRTVNVNGLELPDEETGVRWTGVFEVEMFESDFAGESSLDLFRRILRFNDLVGRESSLPRSEKH